MWKYQRTDLMFQALQKVINRSIILKSFGLGIGNIVIAMKHGQGLGSLVSKVRSLCTWPAIPLSPPSYWNWVPHCTTLLSVTNIFQIKLNIQTLLVSNESKPLLSAAGLQHPKCMYCRRYHRMAGA